LFFFFFLRGLVMGVEPIAPEARRGLVLVSKVVVTIASGVEFDANSCTPSFRHPLLQLFSLCDNFSH
jgi:hypothetical protein